MRWAALCLCTVHPPGSVAVFFLSCYEQAVLSVQTGEHSRQKVVLGNIFRSCVAQRARRDRGEMQVSVSCEAELRTVSRCAAVIGRVSCGKAEHGSLCRELHIPAVKTHISERCCLIHPSMINKVTQRAQIARLLCQIG